MITNETMRAVIDTNVVGSLVHLQEASRLMARNRRAPSSMFLLSSGGLVPTVRRFTLLLRPRSLG